MKSRPLVIGLALVVASCGGAAPRASDAPASVLSGSVPATEGSTPRGASSGGTPSLATITRTPRPGTGGLHVTVTDEQGSPATGFEVSVERPEYRGFVAREDVSGPGLFEQLDIVPGLYRVLLSKRGHALVQLELVVHAGEVTRGTATLRPEAVAARSVLVSDRAGRYDPAARTVADALTASDGDFVTVRGGLLIRWEDRYGPVTLLCDGPRESFPPLCPVGRGVIEVSGVDPGQVPGGRVEGGARWAEGVTITGVIQHP